jgi:hypothetical protein
MLRFALVALLATSACRLSLDDDAPPAGNDGGRLCMPVPSNPTCAMAAADPVASSKLSWITANVMTPNCGGSSCHGMGAGGNPPLGRIVLTTDPHTKLVGVDATFATGRKLVVAGDVGKSYLMVILRHLTLDQADPSPAPEPSGGRYMPLGVPTICCEKLDAMAKWIQDGALNN